MIGVDREVQALQVREGNNKVECLTVVVLVRRINIRAVCGYGPQQRDSVKRKSQFLEYLDKEVDDSAL